MNKTQIPGIAAALICAIIAHFLGVNPALVITIVLIAETATYLIGRSKQARKPRSARQIAYRSVRTPNVTTRAVTKTKNDLLQNPDFIRFTELLNEQSDPGVDEGRTLL